ncbi:hypothetical protein JVU11DRAFT_11455 [Chiua virens]|nr:hypothetical protein JVU11DRAFT_11455 [Chiua virens]
MVRSHIITTSSTSSSLSSSLSIGSPFDSSTQVPPSTQPPPLTQFSPPHGITAPQSITAPHSNLAGPLLDHFGMPGPPPGYHSPIYMDYMHEFHMQRERIKELEIENTKLSTECTTLSGIETNRPMKETHPHIKFWTLAAYHKWLLKPEAQSGIFGKEPYLEEENGDPDVRQQCGFPLFKCAENGWKLERIACLSYSAWHGHHIGEDGKWLKPADKKKRKSELKGKGKASKKFKADPKEKLESLLLDTIPFDTNLGAGPSTDTNTTDELSTVDTTKFTDENTLDRNPFEGEDSALDLYNTNSVGNSVIDNIPIDPTLDSFNSSAVNTNSPTLNSRNSSAVNMNSPAPDEVNTNLGGTNTSDLDIVVHKNTLDFQGREKGGTSKGEKKPAKIRSGPARNGRNLCILCWLHSFKETTNGTTAEFIEYYNSLSKEQHEAYNKEAKDLVARNGWDKDVNLGVLH